MKISCEICPLYTACDYGYDIPCPESVSEAFEKYPELCEADESFDDEDLPCEADESFDDEDLPF